MSILTAIFLLTILVQVSYWFFFYVNVAAPATNSEDQKSRETPVSIVICAKNEALNIQENFESWSGQLTPQDELIIVDDFSTDQTYHIAKKLSANHSNIKVLKTTTDSPGKKQALITAIHVASFNYILVTDADCHTPKHWKSLMTQKLKLKTHFVLGYAPFHHHPTLLNLFQRFECLLTAATYFSFAHAGHPYMGVGRNMLFHKDTLKENTYSHNIASGDDDLLVSAHATSENTQTCIHPDSFVYSEAKLTLKTYLSQKLRHISTSPHYKPSTKLLLSLFSATQILSNILAIFLLTTDYWKVAIIATLLKWTSATLACKKIAHILREGNIFLFTPLLDLLLTFYYVILALSYPFKNKQKWS